MRRAASLRPWTRPLCVLTLLLLCCCALRSVAADDPPSTECASTWSLPYPRRAQLPPDYPPPPPPPGSAVRVQLFILFLVDPSIVLKAVASLTVEGALPLRVVLVDTSPERLLSDGATESTRLALARLGATSRDLGSDSLSVATPPVPLDFQRAHNWVQEMAYAARLHAFYVMHSDAELSAGAQELVGFAADVVRALWAPGPGKGGGGENDPLGVVFFAYDTLALFNPAATLEAGVWDVNFLCVLVFGFSSIPNIYLSLRRFRRSNYGADLDYYHRLHLAGFRESDGLDRVGMGSAKLAARGALIRPSHEVSHSLKSTAWACAKLMRLSFNFEGEWRGRYLDRKWGPHRNASVAFVPDDPSSPPLPTPQMADRDPPLRHKSVETKEEGSGSGDGGGDDAAPSAAAAAAGTSVRPAPKLPGGWVFKGCWRERAAPLRAIPTELAHADTASDCSSDAAAHGFDTIGLQNGGECWACSACAHGEHGRVPRAGCGGPVGGPWVMAVYKRVHAR